MSSYDCVLPVSWPALTERVLPAWCEVLAGERGSEDFCRDFAPMESELEQVIGCPSPEEFAWPRGYLNAIGWRGTLPLDADVVRASGVHEAPEVASLTQWGHDLLCRAIKKRASVELDGPDSSPNSYYGRLHDPPTLQVAGTKSRFRFLDASFKERCEYDWGFYRLSPREGAPGELVDLLRALFLSTRALPGAWILPESDAWIASDDPLICGYLSPPEVAALSRWIPILHAWCEREPERHAILLPLFRDRLERAAHQELGLVAMHNEL